MPPPPIARFATRSTRWFVAVAVASLLASGWLLVSPGEVSRAASVDADGYSRSALGHRGLIEWLRAMGEPVMQSRNPRGPGACGLYVVAEPQRMDSFDLKRMAPILERAKRTLLVLPKRSAQRDPEQPTWAESVELMETDDVRTMCVEFCKCASVQAPHLARHESTSGWQLPNDWPEPRIVGPTQLLRHGRVESIVSCDEGVLLGKVDDLYVLADPDVIENHGLARGDNAELALRMVRLLALDGAIAFDETLHGHRLAPSVWHEAGRYPLVLTTCHVLLLLALLAWVAHARFGPVVDAPPAIGAGKAFLLDNIAALLRTVGGAGPSLRRYGRQRLRAVAEALQAPSGLGDDQCRAFVLARMRGDDRAQLEALLTRAATEASPGASIVAARRIRSLTEDLLHARSRDR